MRETASHLQVHSAAGFTAITLCFEHGITKLSIAGRHKGHFKSLHQKQKTDIFKIFFFFNNTQCLQANDHGITPPLF